MKTLSHTSSFTHESYALILSKEKIYTKKDQQRFFDIGIKNILFMDEGIKASEILDEKYTHKQKLPEVILCYEQLKDITGTAFIKLLQLHPYLITIPIIPIISNRENIPKNIKDILSPNYSSHDLQKALTITQKKILNIQSKNQDTTIFTETITQLKNIVSNKTLKVHDAYVAGLQAIKKRNFQEGITQLQSVLNIDAENINALLALAIAYKEDGNTNKYLETLLALLSIYAKEKKWKQAKDINKRLVVALNGQSNPLYDQAYTFLSLGYVSYAAHAIIAGRITPDQDHIMYKKLLSGCLKTQNPNETIQKLKKCFLQLCDTVLTEKIIYYLENAMLKNKKRETQTLTNKPEEQKGYMFLLNSAQKQGMKKQDIHFDDDQKNNLIQQLEPSKLFKFSPKLQQVISVFKYTYYLLQASKNSKNS